MYAIIDVEYGRFGKKVVASSRIKKNTVVLRLSGVPISFDETKALGDNESFGFQISHDCYIYLDAPGRYINHSCDPNCGVTPSLDLVAIKEVMEGEELTYDYSTTMLERSWTMECKCGSSRCRKTVGDFDQVPVNVQKFYLERNVVQRFIVNALKDK